MSSDSSMDDCNLMLQQLKDYTKVCSDSSMDDCNNVYDKEYQFDMVVQIPLWTIVTRFTYYVEMNLN